MNCHATHNSDAVRHLYVHFPFCARICPYCAFYKVRGNPGEIAQFCRALRREAERVSRNFNLAPETISFGGGTPSALSSGQLEGLLKAFHRVFDLSALREWSIEVNPGSVSEKKARLLREGGISRVSVGVQSWDDELLRLLGREHNARQAEQSFHILRNAGFDNISIDLMFALPQQTEAQWQSSLEKTISLNPEHVSTYCLTYEQNTEFLARLQGGEFQAHDDDEARFFEMTMDTLQSAGYEHYEISNLARPGFRSLHNQAYWLGADYLGLGPSAFSTRGFRRWQNVADHREYARRLFAGESPIENTEALTNTMKRTERIALGLRTREGVLADLIAPHDAQHLISAGLLAKAADRIALTTTGKLVADSVAEELL
jgi:oxygen-independent coproporphyrinogen III oxidase